MKRNLQRFNLDYKLTYKYLIDNFNAANALSIELLGVINSINGCFFTFLTPEANEKNLYQFYNSIFSFVIDVEEAAKFIFDYLKNDTCLTCVFEDVLRSPNNLK